MQNSTLPFSLCPQRSSSSHTWGNEAELRVTHAAPSLSHIQWEFRITLGMLTLAKRSQAAGGALLAAQGDMQVEECLSCPIFHVFPPSGLSKPPLSVTLSFTCLRAQGPALRGLTVLKNNKEYNS